MFVAPLTKNLPQSVQRSKMAPPVDKLVDAAVFDEATPIQGDDAVDIAHRGQSVRNNEHGPAADYVLHVRHYNPLTLVIECASRFVEY